MPVTPLKPQTPMLPRAERARRAAVTAAAVFLALLGLADVLPLRGLFGRTPALGTLLEGGFFSARQQALHHSLSVATGCALLFISGRLRRRVRTAYYIAVALLPVSALLHLFAAGVPRPHGGFSPLAVAEVAVWLLLLALHGSFTRAADPITLRRGALFAAGSLLLPFISAVLGFFTLRRHFGGVVSFKDAARQSFALFTLMDFSAVSPKTPVGAAFAHSAVFLFWAALAVALIFLLKPLVYQPLVSARDRARVRELLLRYGENSISYVDVETDKSYFFTPEAEGFIAYVVEAGVAVCVGDPVGPRGDGALLLGAFWRYCRQNELSVCFCQASEEWLPLYRGLGFGAVKCGEEAVFDLAAWRPAGAKTAKVRQNVRHARRAGITVAEYRPQQARDMQTERGILAVSADWLAHKKSGELSFLLGSVGLEEPLDRRYFVARDGAGEVCAFIVFIPYLGGYYADVTRRRAGAPTGVMETILLAAFDVFRAEGLREATLGVAPLANTRAAGAPAPRVAALLQSVYEHANGFYGFKALYQYKRKYAPSAWVPRYFAYRPARFTPQLAYALIKAQNRGGVRDFLLNRLAHLLRRPRAART